MSFSRSEYTKIDVGSPDPIAGFKGTASRQEGNGGERRTRGGEGKIGERGMLKGGERGKLGE